MIATLFLFASQAMTFTADRIAADNVTHALAASGHIVATSAPFKLKGEAMSRSADGTYRFDPSTYATTCTNEAGHTHWNVTGEVEYKSEDHVLLRNAVLRFWEVPIFYLPYLWYPLETSSGFSWMPGYTSRWGAYLLTRFSYGLLGDRTANPDGPWLHAATRFDLRYEQGFAAGEELKWKLGDFGKGEFDVYYAWDRSDDVRKRGRRWYDQNFGGKVDRHRYGLSFRHDYEPTERDIVRLRGSYYSDSYFRRDFYRKTMFNWKSQYAGYETSGVFWEHLENSFAFGGEVAGNFNDFYTSVGRLPEFYFDVAPMPVFDLPLNYESSSRAGYLMRSSARHSQVPSDNPFAALPGRWADYETARFDTYHRITAPFKAFDDVLSVVPRLGYHGTCWNRSGSDNLTGWGKTDNAGDLYRSILEGGVTFAARGSGWLDDRRWRHMVEPYFDVLAQKAWLKGAGNRPYVFDAVDAATMWEDQFAGRSRNLPFTYYGVAPGLRNVWEKADEKGNLRRFLDLDAYVALQFNDTSYRGTDSAHRLAKPGEPNYGSRDCRAIPGMRLKWDPAKDVSLLARVEYDAADNAVPLADAGLQHVVSDTFKYHVTYALRDYRMWDFSSTPYDADKMANDNLNYARFQYVEAGFENQPLDWFAWSPFVRWDIRENELDSIGTWVDFLTDCLGFRFLVEYENEYERIDGYRHGDDWSFGFYIYLRAFGAGNSNIFR